MSNLTVEVVSPESRLWSGEASMVSARTIEGDIGVLPNHSELLGVLADGEVVVKAADGNEHKFLIAGGFISVAKNRVSILGQVKA
jgi:F-type H+-transporting ATPase subunit epsilon